MILGHTFDHFARESPVSVMFRGLLEHALPQHRIDALFREHAQAQEERELLFSTVVDTLALAVTQKRPSLHAAYQAQQHKFSVSVTSLYNKLSGVEPNVAPALVRESANRLEPVLQAMSPQGTGPGPVLLPGYRVKILDGKHLDGTEHRLQETRTVHSAPLPGHLLAVLDPERRLALDVFPCEDAYAQERQLLPQVLQTVEANDVWVADRNFCTTGFLFGLHRREAFFVIRQHGSTLSKKRYLGDQRFVGRCPTGEVYEQSLEITDPDSGETLVLRRITVKLDQPTREGDTEIHVLTQLPEAIDAITVAMLYLERWQIENLFGERAQALDAEIDTLCYPAAALLAYCVALMTYNLQSTLQGAIHQTHGDRATIQRLSSYYLADEIRSTWRGMQIAIAPEHWRQAFGDLSSERMAQILTELATGVRVEQFLKTTRGERKPPPQRKGGLREKHVSTQRLLEERKNAATKC